MKHTVSNFSSFVLPALGALLLALSCTKPTPFGAGLLDDQLGIFQYTDTLTVHYSILQEDSILTSDRSSTADFMFCGQLNDPVFGRSQADIFTLFRLPNLNPNFRNARVDSIVMVLRYDAPGFYGDTLQPQTIRVHRVAADTIVNWDRTYYSNQSLPVGELLGEAANILPLPGTNTPLFGDTTLLGPHLRIPLNNVFGQELLDLDSLDLTADTLFWRKVRGLRISAEPAGAPGAMLAFDMNNASFSRIRLYYKYDSDTITYSRTTDFSFVGGNKFNHFNHDYSGAPVESYINQAGEDYLFAQGMSGLRLKLEIPYAHLLENIAVNKAELELTAANFPNDNALLRPANQLVFTEIFGDTAVGLTSDVLYSLGTALNGTFSAFGGNPEKEMDNGMEIDRYRLTLTRRFQAMVDNTSGNLKDQTIYVNVYPQSRSAMRAIFYGPKNGTFPAKLTLKYTLVQ